MTADELYSELILERFGPIPWLEHYECPAPPPKPKAGRGPIVRLVEPVLVTAERQRVLSRLDDEEASAA